MPSTITPRMGGFRPWASLRHRSRYGLAEQLRREHPDVFLPNLIPAFAQRRAIFGPHELRDDRIRAASYLADDLSPEARRVLRDGEAL